MNKEAEENKQKSLEEALKTIGKAKKEVLLSSAKRVSRRLLVAKQKESLLVTCPETGINSLLEIPAIRGCALVYNHPLSSYENCRGLAQQGFSYLNQLDTQVLAGILIVLANHYELIRYQPTDSGSQKNAILRTAGKELLISAIILIEEKIHSSNSTYLPQLSLIFTSSDEEIGAMNKLDNWLKLVAEAIAKPDLEAWDENKVQKVSKPLFIKEKEKEERKISFLARSEIRRAKKELKEDSKVAKELISNLQKEGKIDSKGRNVLIQLLDSILTMEHETAIKLGEKLKEKESVNADSLAFIFKKDRSILLMDISEVEEMYGSEKTEEIPPTDFVAEWKEKLAEVSNDLEGDEVPSNQPTIQQQEIKESEVIPTPPAGLTKLQATLWVKKWKEAKAKERLAPISSPLPSVVTYIPTDLKQNLGKDS